LSEKKNRNRKKELKIQRAQKAKDQQEKSASLKRLMPLIKAFALWVILVFLVNIPAFKDVFVKFFLDFTMKTVLFLSKILFLPVEYLQDYHITVNSFDLQIIYECTAYNFYLFVIPLVIFSNWTIKQKIINILIFITVIILVNYFRFIIMGYVGSWFPSAFEFIHDYMWNVIFGIMVFAVWLWREKASNPKPQSN